MRGSFILVLAAFAASIVYVVWHLWRLTPGGWPWKLAAACIYLLWMGLFMGGLAFSEKLPVSVAALFQRVGNLWLMAQLYLMLVLLVADLATLLHFHPARCLQDSLGVLCSVVGIVAFILLAGSLHHGHKYRAEMTIHSGKPLEKPLKIILASDLHIGYTTSRAELAGWIDRFNAEQPDLVLFGGDVIDREVRPVLEGGYAAEFRRLHALVYAVLGNHEYYGDLQQAIPFLADAGIVLLRDSVAHVKGINLIGRDDRSNRQRQPLKELADSLQGFTLVLDHQPSQLEEAEQAGIDFQFSGHTHRGQVWPISWITDALFEKSWGPHQRGNTRYYISSGMGIWGPKIRLGTRAEYLVLYLD